MKKTGAVVFLVLLVCWVCKGIAQASLLPDSLWADIAAMPDDTAKVNQLNQRAAEIGYRTPEFQAQLAGKALKLATQLGYLRGIGQANNLLGMAARRTGEYAQAHIYFQEALTVGEALGDLSLQGAALNNQGIVQWNLHAYRDGLAYFREAQRIQLRRNDTLALANAIANMGMSYNGLGLFDSAIYFFKVAQKIYEAKAEKRGMHTMGHNLAVAYREKGDFEESIRYFRRALDYFEQSGDVLRQINTLKNIAKAYLRLERPGQALPYIEKADSLATGNHLLKEQIDCAETWLLYHTQIGNHLRAFDAFYRYTALRDSAFDLEQTTQLNEVRAKYETEKKVDQLNEARKRSEVQTRFFIVISLIALFSLGILSYTLRLRTLRHKAEEEKFLAVAAREKTEKELLQQEVDFKNRELTAKAMHLIQKNKTLSEIRDQLLSIPFKERSPQVLRVLQAIRPAKQEADEWEEFKHHFEKVHPDFFKVLAESFPTLTPNERRLCAYLRLNLTTKQIATMLHTGSRAVEMGRYRLKKKVGLQPDDDLLAWIHSI